MEESDNQPRTERMILMRIDPFTVMRANDRFHRKLTLIFRKTEGTFTTVTHYSITVNVP